MFNKYRKKDILLTRKSAEYFRDEEGESYCVMETYKAKAQLHIVLNGLISSRELAQNEEAYELLLCRLNEGELECALLGSIKVDDRGQARVLKKIDLNHFESMHAEIWNFERLLIVVSSPNEETRVVLEGKIKEDEEPQIDIRDYIENTLNEEMKVQDGFYPFANDETLARWYRVSDFEGCPVSLARCLEKGKKYGHYLIGDTREDFFLAVPGRFMASEEVVFVENETSLWQPLKGAEHLCKNPEEMDEESREYIYGYWIAKISKESQEIANC